MIGETLDARRGFEPRLLGSEPSVLPLDERAINWCPWGDSNSQHLRPQRSDSTSWPTRTLFGADNGIRTRDRLVGNEKLYLWATSALLVLDSGIEPRPPQSQWGMQPLHLIQHSIGAPRRTLTFNPQFRRLTLLRWAMEANSWAISQLGLLPLHLRHLQTGFIRYAE